MINQIKTLLLLAVLSGLLMAIGGFIGGSRGVVFALILSLFMNGLAYFFSDKIVLNMYRARKLDPQHYRAVYEMVDELSEKMKMPMPKLWLVDTPMANAFATGRNPANASIAVTSGILGLLSPAELRGVLAHELSHVNNRDILVTTIAATLASAIGYMAHMLQYMAYFGTMSREDRRRTNPLAMLLVAMLMPLAATLIQLAIHRRREYMADESGAHVSDDPLALASALEKLHLNIPHAHLRNDDVERASTAPLFIVHPFSAGAILALFSTHPPIVQRIARLREMHTNMNT